MGNTMRKKNLKKRKKRFCNIPVMHSFLSAAHYESLQDKLAQLRDAREALDALREDHREKRRREMEELERQRQIQMAQKLDVMRQKKHVSLIYEPVHEKNNNLGFRPLLTQTRLYSHRKRLEA